MLAVELSVILSVLVLLAICAVELSVAVFTLWVVTVVVVASVVGCRPTVAWENAAAAGAAELGSAAAAAAAARGGGGGGVTECWAAGWLTG